MYLTKMHRAIQCDLAESISHLTVHLPPTRLMKWEQGIYTITDQPEQLDIELIHRFLSTESYWAKDIPKAIVVRSIEHALCFGLFREQQQIGFGRVITDRATFAYLSDVFVLPSHRGEGLGKWLVECILRHPDLQGLRRWMLATGDAHGLYQQFGFALSEPGILMQKVNPETYHPVAEAHPANDTFE